MTDILKAEDLRPDHPIVHEATLEALKGRVGEEEVRKFLAEAATSVPNPIGATGTLNLVVWGKATCDPDGQPWKWDTTVWGGPAYFGTGVGFMYTAYATWDEFFRNVNGIHCQGIASGGGILQFNWFKDALPVGQWNAVSGAIGLAEAGGSGKWEPK